MTPEERAAGYWTGLVDDLNKQIGEQSRRADHIWLAILADEPGNQLFGKPVEFTAHWPDGLPPMFKSEAEMREWARQQLAEMQTGEREQVRKERGR